MGTRSGTISKLKAFFRTGRPSQDDLVKKKIYLSQDRSADLPFKIELKYVVVGRLVEAIEKYCMKKKTNKHEQRNMNRKQTNINKQT